MKNSRFYILALLTCLLLTLAACGSTTDPNAPKDDKSSEEAPADIEFSSIIDFETKDISELPNDPVELKKANIPSDVYFPEAHKGTFILAGHSFTHFYNYKEGLMSDFDLNGHGDPHQRTSSGLYLFDTLAYTIESIAEYEKDDKSLVEINVVTGEKRTLLDVEHVNYLMEKQGDILYLQEEETLLAFDTTTEEEVWTADTDSNLYFHSAHTTDKTILLLSDEGLAVYSLDDGEKVYETDGYFFDAVADNENFYIMEHSEETLYDHEVASYNILKFDEQNEAGELLFTTPTVTKQYLPEDTNIHLYEDTLFVKAPFALLAYDKSSADFLWGTSVDGDIEKGHTDKDESYDFRTAYQNGNVYSRVTAWGDGSEGSLFTIMDSNTGEVNENYLVDSGEIIGPVVDGEKAIILHRDDLGYTQSFILD